MELTDSATDAPTRRNTVAIVLSQLKNKRGVRSLLREARRSTGGKVSMKEMLTRTPSGLESPTYEVVKSETDSGYEIRKYDDFAVCSTTDFAGPSGFKALAGYIFGKNKEETKMAMTTPVFMYSGDDSKRMSFVMPSEYWGDENKLANEAPTPLEDSGVKKEAKQRETVAALWFGGVSTSREVARRKEELLKKLGSDKDFAVAQGSEPYAASYNDPFTSPWKRRNEVLVRVTARASSPEQQ